MLFPRGVSVLEHGRAAVEAVVQGIWPRDDRGEVERQARPCTGVLDNQPHGALPNHEAARRHVAPRGEGEIPSKNSIWKPGVIAGAAPKLEGAS